MYDALELLVDFFHANEKGLEMKKITSEQYLVSVLSDNCDLHRDYQANAHNILDNLVGYVVYSLNKCM